MNPSRLAPHFPMKTPLLRFLPLLLALTLPAAATMKVVSGRIDELPAFPSKLIDTRTVYVWMPDGYTPEKKYAVLYMHDGQMLFDPAVTWNKQSWHVDRIAGELLKAGKLRDFIVVGVPSISAIRFAEYYPQKAYEAMPAELRKAQVDSLLKGTPLADRYLKFLVTELKPYIDSHYSTLTGPADTFLMGSSMGGLISLYGMCEYPDVFGAVACLSTHTPMADPTKLDERSESEGPAYFRAYVKAHLPPAATHRLYMDHGDGTLDKFYGPYQLKLDAVIRECGYTAANFDTRVFPGTDHSEVSWSARLDIPLTFLLGK